MRITTFIVALCCSVFAQELHSQEQTKSQTVRGYVRDIVTGAPLRGATVRVFADTTLIDGAITTREGAFSVADVPVGRRKVLISYLGYEPYVLDDVLVTSGKEVVLNVDLTESFSTADAVTVEYDRITDATMLNNEFVSVSGRTFNIEDTKRYAGSLGDPSRMAQNFAGVTGANDSRNDIVVRGNSPAGMLWQMQGMNIPNPNHFGSLVSTGGPVSILNNNLLGKSDFLTSAFPAMYGNAISGAFDIRLRDGNQNKLEVLAQMGFNGLEANIEGPMWENSSFLVSYRYSTLGIFDAIGLDFGTGGATPNYQDLTFKFQSAVGENGRIELFGVGGLSDISFLGNEVDTTLRAFYSGRNQNTIVNYRTGWTGLSYEHRIDDNTTAKLTVGANGTFEKFHGDSIDNTTRIEYPAADAQFETQTFSTVFNLRHKISRTTNVSVGGFVDAQEYTLFNVSGLSNDTPRVNVDIVDNATLTQGYVQLQHRLFEWLLLNGGIHTQHFTIGDAFSVEPRAGISAVVSSDVILTAGYGLHSQRQGVYTYNVQTPTPTGYTTTNRELGFTKSHHGVVGAEWFVTEDIRVKGEAYYQSLFDVPVTIAPSSFSSLNTGADFAPETQDSLVNNGTGRNVGVELTIEHFFKNGFYFLGTTSIFDSKFTGSDGVERNTAFNTKYVVNLLAGKEWTFADGTVVFGNVRFSTTGGRFLSPIDLEASIERGSTVYDETNAYSIQQSAYLRLDVKVGYRMEFANSSLEFALDLQNITNHDNIFSQQFDPASGTILTQYQQGFFPIPMIKYTF